MSGLTLTGFDAKTVAQIITELQTAQAATVDPTLNGSSTGVIANLNMAVALQLAEVWELAQEIYDAHDPNSAEGVALDHNGALIGVSRELPIKSTVTLTAVVTLGAFIVKGSVVSNPAIPTVRFVTLADFSAAAAGTFTIAAEAETAGAVNAGAGTLTKIESPASGWTSVTNLSTAVPGAPVENDEDYRFRQADERAAVGGSTLASIVADIKALTGVISCTYIENVTDLTVDTVPPHSFEIIVRGGDADAIAQSIWDNHPAGIQSFGSSTGNARDTELVPHVVSFTRPTPVVINVTYTASYDTSYALLGIRHALETASVNPKSPAYMDNGKPVYLVRLLSIAADVQGVINCTLDIALSPTVPATAIPSSPDKTLAITARQVATFDTATWSGP